MAGTALLTVLIVSVIAAASAAKPAVHTALIAEWQVCTHRPDACAPGLSCDGRRASKRCIKYKPAGMRCPADEHFWICEAGLVCESEVCKIPIGGGCAGATSSCVAGAECSTASGAAVCAPEPADLGESCGASQQCANGLTCDAGVCSLPKGADCTANPASCAAGLSCDGKRAAKRCIVYKAAGMGCPAREDFWICAPGLVCETDVCRVPVGGSCDGAAEAFCANGARCRGNARAGRTCRVPRGRLGDACDEATPCRNRFVCDGTCKLGVDAPCSAESECAGDLLCVGTRREKTCRPGRTEGRRCGTIGALQCAPGLSCVNNACVDGTLGRGKRCGRAGFCEAGLVCAGRGRGRKCVTPMGIGQKCGVDPYWVCAPNARCLRSRCREW